MPAPGAPSSPATMGVPGTISPAQVTTYEYNIFHQRNFGIAANTRSSVGVLLPGATMYLLNNVTMGLEQTTISDSGGNYEFIVDPTQSYWILAHKAGSPDLAGISRRGIVGT